jgi:hypothetical protein
LTPRGSATDRLKALCKVERKCPNSSTVHMPRRMFHSMICRGCPLRIANQQIDHRKCAYEKGGTDQTGPWRRPRSKSHERHPQGFVQPPSDRDVRDRVDTDVPDLKCGPAPPACFCASLIQRGS